MWLNGLLIQGAYTINNSILRIPKFSKPLFHNFVLRKYKPHKNHLT